ncbi:group 1 truncated hemoglobin [Nonomuraea sp. MG754425]|uniref:group I truncated hemoglobin n=1 Tax=Nonomuraea sp. MG754425 TaxID=2570319 RepID=UPI001F1AF504|nr:group 1 truncated hemoglobin [Nonomuraea sp. MG754425]MCF6473487.1 group 1 truncated hemoglobin [Nonomuraea sp. MG754425]
MASYYEQVGASAIRDVVDRFYTVVLDDVELKPYFDGVDLARLKRHMVVLLCSVLGGPEAYEGRDLGDAHQGMGISGEHYEKVGGILVTVLRDDFAAGDDLVEHVVGVLGQVRGAIVERPVGAAG